MAKTYLQLINDVLRRLRESEVSSVGETTYSAMVGDYINDAKDLVEAAWSWTALRSIKTITTADGTSTYSLTGAGRRPTILTVHNDTQNHRMQRQSQAYFDRQNYVGAAANGSPRYWTIRGYDSSDDVQIAFHPTPDGVYSIKFNVVSRQDVLSSGATEITVPWRPVMHMAVALLARERGEAGGTTAAEYFNIADQHLSDAIALDYSLVEGELDFTAGYNWDNNTGYLGE